MLRLIRHHFKVFQRNALPGALLALVFCLDLTLVQLHKAEHFCGDAPPTGPLVLETPGAPDSLLTHNAESCPICQHLGMLLVTPKPASLVRDMPVAAPSLRLPATVDHPGRVDASPIQPRAPPAVVNG